MPNKKNPMLLDADDSAFKSKLLLPENSPDILPDDFESLLPLLEGARSKGEVPWKWVQPTQGMCLKTHLPDGKKVFINVCQTPDIPEPHNVDEEMLLKMYASLDDETPDMGIRIPLSIGDCHEELDKSGEPCSAYDVAVSTSFFERAQNSRVHMRFLVQVAIESVADKFKLELDADQYTVLKNRKAMGRLQRHRIEQRGPKLPLIQEVGSMPSTSSTSSSSALSTSFASTSTSAAGAAPKGQPPAPVRAQAATSASTSTRAEPSPASAPAPTPAGSRRPPERWRMVRRPAPDGSSMFIAELTLADVTNAGEVCFRAGDDRLVVESSRRGYAWDVFVPMQLNADAARAVFVRSDRVLNIQIPIVAS